jgi:hypothetical protein
MKIENMATMFNNITQLFQCKEVMETPTLYTSFKDNEINV